MRNIADCNYFPLIVIGPTWRHGSNFLYFISIITIRQYYFVYFARKILMILKNRGKVRKAIFSKMKGDANNDLHTRY